ncbi:hypothetical protein, partial [Pseudoalteromonas sp.]|uniref:hypothetical protein n=1 Tax=Pseudoalteromonas sp. TaxID=53249 RepID=UPI002625266B
VDPEESDLIFNYLGTETVTVPAGTFDHCLKIQADIGPGGYTDHLYFAKDVGLIKAERVSTDDDDEGWFLLVDSMELLAELHSATINGVDYP